MHRIANQILDYVPEVPDCPEACILYKHRNGQWAKKIKGRTTYFGTDSGKALKKYLGTIPYFAKVLGNSTSVRALVADWLRYKKTKIGSELTAQAHLPILRTDRQENDRLPWQPHSGEINRWRYGDTSRGPVTNAINLAAGSDRLPAGVQVW